VEHVVIEIARSLRKSGFMLWETLWALIVGFSLSGAVQAFVSKDQMQSRLGDHRPRTVARAAGYGMVSSSCSYAASAMSKSLFARGADFTSAMIFMIASTNLVVELGVVLLVLLGWQFAVAEFVGGPVMIVLLSLVGASVFSAALVSRARQRVLAMSPDHGVTHDDTASSPEHSARTLTGWSNASTYAVADATMLRRELLIGYVVAGFLAVLVPTSWWGDVFLRGHGNWTSVENALVGPLIAVVSWVCSVGNVPLAAALWHGGISFGGVIAFIFADLIAMPLILIYRKFYGDALTLRIVGVFYAVMVVAGLTTEMLFRSTGLIPTSRILHVSAERLSWNYTTYLNIVAFVVAAAVWSLARRGRHLREASGYAIDPVCQMQVRIADAPARASVHGQSYYFCSDRCRERFIADHADGDESAPTVISPSTMVERTHGTAAATSEPKSDFIDPICGMSLTPDTSTDQRPSGGVPVYFCSSQCAKEFDARDRAH